MAGLALLAFGARALRGPAVEAVRISRTDLLETLVVSGRVLARSKASLGSPVIGRVEAVLVEEGDRVKAGQVLARLDESEAAAALDAYAGTAAALRDPIDQEITIGGVAYRVVGLFEKKGNLMGGGSNDNYIAIPITAFDDQCPESKNGGGDTIHIATVPRRPEDYDALIEEETAILRVRRGLRPDQENDFAIYTTVGQLGPSGRSRKHAVIIPT